LLITLFIYVSHIVSADGYRIKAALQLRTACEWKIYTATCTGRYKKILKCCFT